MIKLHTEIENTNSCSAWEKVDGVKQKLNTRLSELAGLLLELGQIRSNDIQERSVRRKSTVLASPKKSPNQRQWKNKIVLADMAGEADGRLPTIMEDKHFPRRTLE